jgi:hypothetical protein
MRFAVTAAVFTIAMAVVGCEPGDGVSSARHTHTDHDHADHSHDHAGHDHDHAGHDHDHAGHDHADHDHADHDHDHDQVVSHHPITDKGVGPCTCAEARLINGWCRHCGVGLVAGLPVPSSDLYEALDAHGHDYQLTSIECPTCRAAIETNGFCNTCLMGFHDNLLYVSKLTHSMAKGQVVQSQDMACDICRRHLGDAGWCQVCQVGIAGNVAFENEADHETAAAAFRRLQEAVGMLDRCETCAIVMFTGGACRVCAASAVEG